MAFDIRDTRTVPRSWGLSCGDASLKMGIADGAQATWEGPTVGANTVVTTVNARTQSAGIRFDAYVNGQDYRLGPVLDWQSGNLGQGVRALTGSIKVTLAGITSPLRIISRRPAEAAYYAVLTLDSDGKFRVYDKNNTLLLTASTAIASGAHARFGLVLDTFTSQHGGNWLLWLVAEISGVLTEVGVASIAADSWGSADGNWWWGEDLDGSTNRGAQFWMDDLVGHLCSVSHTDAPHLAQMPFAGVYAQEADADGAAVQWTATPSNPPNAHMKNWQTDDDATGYNETLTANLKERVAGEDISLGGTTIIHCPQLRIKHRDGGGGKTVWNPAVHYLLGASESYQTTAQPTTSWAINGGHNPITRPGGGSWTGNDVAAWEYGCRTLDNHNADWEVTAVVALWAKQEALVPLLSVPPIGAADRRKLAQVT